MGSATLEALGLVAHGVHLGLVLLGLVGVCVLLVPGWREHATVAPPGRFLPLPPSTTSGSLSCAERSAPGR